MISLASCLYSLASYYRQYWLQKGEVSIAATEYFADNIAHIARTVVLDDSIGHD
jgi:hypothetical protein